jgi:hypothetical protein
MDAPTQQKQSSERLNEKHSLGTALRVCCDLMTVFRKSMGMPLRDMLLWQ